MKKKEKQREKKFRLFKMHGVVQPAKNTENRIRNGLFMAGSLDLVLSQKVKRKIRLVAYEMPLEKRITRGNCIDLFGYDQEHNPYIIELKKGDSSYSIPKSIKQVNRYESMLIPVLSNVEKEIKEQLFLDEFKLTNQIRKILLAPAAYYDNTPSKAWKSHRKEGVLFCYLRSDKNLNGLAEKVDGEKGISVHVHNRPLLRSWCN